MANYVIALQAEVKSHLDLENLYRRLILAVKGDEDALQEIKYTALDVQELEYPKIKLEDI